MELIFKTIKITLWVAVGIILVPCAFMAQLSGAWVEWGESL